MYLYRSIVLLFVTLICLQLSSAGSVNKLAMAAGVSESCSFFGSYQQSKELDGLNKPLLSSGVLYYDCQHGVIWKTTAPILQSLILLNNGSSYRIKNQQSEKLSSRQTKMLGEIINAFISNDLERLSKHFNISKKDLDNDSEADFQVVLLPKRKRLKRAFKKVIITNYPNEYQNIEMIDKMGLRTLIKAKKDSLQIPEASCTLIGHFDELECALLLKTTDS